MTLVGFSVATLMLALFQWMELLVVRNGGTSVCSINETVSCQRVWDSAFASRIHSMTGVPIAGFGLVWALTAFVLALQLSSRRIAGGGAKAEEGLVSAIKWTSIAGIFSSMAFALASTLAGALCLTCLSTYVLVFGYASAAFLMLPGSVLPPQPAAAEGLLRAAGLSVVGFLLVLYPGLHTPHAGASPMPVVAASGGLSDLLAHMSSSDQQMMSDVIGDYVKRPVTQATRTPRLRLGAADAPVQVIEFTDILCPHCRHFSEALTQLRESVPAGSMSVEPRQYPLDHDCNPSVTRSDGTGVHCLAAKALICLEANPAYWKVSESLFEHQTELTPDRVRVLINEQGVDVNALDTCIASSETAAKLADDEKYAQELNLRGTPLVIVNGREALPMPQFLYALALAKGNIDAVTALPLPPARPIP